jgi:hypothetical protein
LGLTDAWSFRGLAALRHRWDALELEPLFGSVASARQAGFADALCQAARLDGRPVAASDTISLK